MKTFLDELGIVMRLSVKLVNFVISKALNTHIFKKKKSDEYDYEHYTLLFYIEIRWLSKENILKR